MKSRIYLATKNRHKIREIQQIFKDTNIEVKFCPDYMCLPEETGKTFEENAFQKAAYAQKFMPRERIVGEDSGLIVSSLSGAPGVYSARFAGPECNYQKNIDKILNVMAPYQDIKERQAKFVTVICLLGPEEKKFFRGEIAGVITFSGRGTNGFGYDPVFEVPELGKTLAELSASKKNSLSHRFIAFRKLADYLVKKERKK